MSEQIRELSKAEYESTFVPPMRDVTAIAEEVVALWPYAEEAMKAAFPSTCSCDWNADYIYGSHLHVLIPSDVVDLYLVVVIVKPKKMILGYYKLDLGALYGLREENAALH